MNRSRCECVKHIAHVQVFPYLCVSQVTGWKPVHGCDALQEWSSEALQLYEYALGMRQFVAALRAGCVDKLLCVPWPL